jgi:hypothetical protein
MPTSSRKGWTGPRHRAAGLNDHATVATAGGNHDTRGRFTPGNKAAVGNPHARRMAELRSAFLDAGANEPPKKATAAPCRAPRSLAWFTIFVHFLVNVSVR